MSDQLIQEHATRGEETRNMKERDDLVLAHCVGRGWSDVSKPSQKYNIERIKISALFKKRRSIGIEKTCIELEPRSVTFELTVPQNSTEILKPV
jgi:hypothetical protein